MTTKDNLNLINEMGTKGFDRLTALGEINLRAWERLATRQLDAMGLMMDQGLRQMRLATESKGYNEYLKGQVELTKDLSTRLTEETKTNLQVAGEVRDQYRTWVQQGMSELTADLRKAAPQA